MAKRSLSEQLDEYIQVIIANPDAPPPTAPQRLAALLGIAADLRDLPRPDFKARLKADLERRGWMTTTVKYIREGFHTVTPYLLVERGPELVEFVKLVFGATELFSGTGSAGGLHAEVRIGDSMLMIGGGKGVHEMPAALHTYVDQVDFVYQRALEAGAASIDEPADKNYGERGASVKDPFGNNWYLATPLTGKPLHEGLRSVTPYFHPRDAAKMIDFLKQAFEAEEVARYAGPDGTIVHAAVRIGDSLIEMGEPRGPYQPMPSAIYLYVEDVDTLYERAVRAGGISMQKPADQPYGDRTAWVKDAFENIWFVATHIEVRAR